MNSHKIRQLLKNDEGFKLDFKAKLSLNFDSEKKEFVKDVIAIANTPGGRGYILFGIEDQTRAILGLEEIPEHIEERIQLIIANRCIPPVPVSFDTVEVEGKVVGVLTIFKSMQVPHQMLQTGAFYVRRGSTTDKATIQEIANMLQQYGMLSFENVPCRQSTLEALDKKLIEKQLGILESYKTQEKLLLSTLGVISADLEKEKYYPTYGGLLLFGKNPQDFIPQAVLEVVYEDQVMGIRGNILAMLKSFEETLQPIVPERYPTAGLMEVVTNAIIHRNYWNNAQYTQVVLGEETVVVTNPMSYEAEGLRTNRWRVNPWLYSRLLIMGQKQNNFHLGIGLEGTKALFKNQDGVKIEAHYSEGVFEVTLPGFSTYR